MAASFFVLIVPLLLLVSPASSLQCTSQKFSGSANYTDCADLPTLKAFLHWSYDHAKSILSVAFIAPPAKPDGWVAWGLNPTGTGMAGAQALLGYKDSNGSVLVKTYNISSYSSIVESKLSFEVLEKRGEFSDGVVRIFARLSVPASMTGVNQIWQVGSSVKNGRPEVHAFNPENLSAKWQVEFAKGIAPSASPAHSPGPSTTATPPSAGNGTGPGSGAERKSGWSLATISGLFLLVGILAFY